MKFLHFGLSLALAHTALSSVLFERSGCDANNCARAVTGTNAQPAATIRRADCSSYMDFTAVGPSRIATITSTIPATTATVEFRVVCTVSLSHNITLGASCSTTTEFFVARSSSLFSPSTISHSSSLQTTSLTSTVKTVPTYASACTETGTINDYSSACSCWGITGSTTTRRGGTITVTRTVGGGTLTSSVTISGPTATVTASW